MDFIYGAQESEVMKMVLFPESGRTGEGAEFGMQQRDQALPS